MTVLQPIFQELNTTDQSALTLRLASEATIVNGQGPAGEDDFKVSQHSTGADSTVDVAPGTCFVRGSQVGRQGVYAVSNDAPVNIPVSTAHATLTRYDLVIIEVADQFYSGAVNNATVKVIPGTASASPSAPDLDALGHENYTVLALLMVVSGGATVVPDGLIIDVRRNFGAGSYEQRGSIASLGGRINCTSGTRPSSPVDGQEIWETDTQYELTWTGTRWVHTSTIFYASSGGSDVNATTAGTSIVMASFVLPQGPWEIQASGVWEYVIGGNQHGNVEVWLDGVLQKRSRFTMRAGGLYAPVAISAAIDHSGPGLVEFRCWVNSSAGTTLMTNIGMTARAGSVRKL